MKKTYICLLALVCLTITSACQATNEHVTSGNENHQTNIEEDISSDDNLNCSYDSFIYEVSEADGVFQTNEKSDSFAIIEYFDDSLPKTTTMKLFEKEHSLIYDGSLYNPFLGKAIDFYIVSDLKNGFSETNPPTIAVDNKTGEIIQYTLFPYQTMPKTEDECIKIVKNLIGDAVALEELQYSITTNYYISSKNGVQKTTVNGFYSCESNERLGSYNLRFSKHIEGIPTFKEVYAVFGEDVFTITIANPEYDNAILLNSAKFFDGVDISVISHLSDAIHSRYVVTSCSIKGKKIFVKNGVPYILSDVEVEFKEKESDEEAFCLLVQVITEIKNDSGAEIYSMDFSG